MELTVARVPVRMQSLEGENVAVVREVGVEVGVLVMTED